MILTLFHLESPFPEGVSRIVLPRLETLRIRSPAYLQQFDLPMLQSLSVEGTYDSLDGDLYELWIESIPEGIISLKIEDVVLATMPGLHPQQQRSFGNLVKMKMSCSLGVNLDIRDKFFAPQLKEVKISEVRPHFGCDNIEDVHLQFLGSNGLLARSPITHVCLQRFYPSNFLLSSILDTANPILPSLTFVSLTGRYSRLGSEFERLKREFSLKRSNVQLSISEA
jgi:hypothetical protein